MADSRETTTLLVRRDARAAVSVDAMVATSDTNDWKPGSAVTEATREE